MKRKRIGNDLHIAWSLLMKDGNIFLLEGKELSVYLKTPFGKVELSDYIIKDNKVEWTFFGKDQKVIGQYSLILVVNYGKEGMVSTDVCNFVELVAHSCQEGGSSPSGVQVESIELTSIVEYGGGAEVDLTDYLTKEEAGRTYLPREEFSAGIALRNVGAEDTDESVEEPDLPTPSASNEWKCVAERRFLEGEDNIIFTSYADGTSLLAKEAIIEVINDQKAEAIITGYVRIQSTSNKNRCSFGTINYETNAMADGGICVQEMRIETSPYFFTKAFVAQNMKNSVEQTTPVLEQIGHNPQIFEDIVSIELATNLRLTSAAPLVKIYAR